MSNSASDLGVFKTPLEPAPRLAAALGLNREDLWIKRDDWLGHGGGGNKLRKLEYLCGDAVQRGATTLVTSGAAQPKPSRGHIRPGEKTVFVHTGGLPGLFGHPLSTRLAAGLSPAGR